MKKTITILAALCMVVAANATILRVSNVQGSSAPYTSLEAAHDAAASGDTIMVEGSSTTYDNFTISKPIVLIGPGFFLLENDIMKEAQNPASFYFINVQKDAEGTVIEGVHVRNSLTTEAKHTVVKRCWIFDETSTGGGLALNARNCVAHQNFVGNISTRAFYVDDYNDQITNNIILGGIGSIGGSYIAYNTFIVDLYYDTDEAEDRLESCFANVITSTIEHNIISRMDIVTNGWNDIDTNSFNDNFVYGPKKEGQIIGWSRDLIDTQVKEATQTHTEAGYGAFAGADPYVLSGIPSGPIITDIEMPVSVEMGSKLNVTIKVDISR